MAESRNLEPAANAIDALAPARKTRFDITQFNGPGHGRPKGIPDKNARIKREFLDKVFGLEGSAELAEFAEEIRAQFMDGTIDSGIAQLLIKHWLGVPKETLELKAEVAVGRVERHIIDVTPRNGTDG